MENNSKYDIIVTYKKVKYLRLKVKDGKVLVSAPLFTLKSTITKFINANIEFIETQLNKQEVRKINNELHFEDKVIILGNEYQILRTSLKPKVTDHFIFVKEDVDIRKQVKKLFKDKQLDYFNNLTLKYFELMNLKCDYPKIIIKDVKTKWGSYNKKNHSIEYAGELLFKDKIVYDYIVVHELSHILEFNHSKNFYEIVERYCPNYKKFRKILKEM